MASDKVYIHDEVVRKENKYLAKMVAISVAALVGTLLYVNNSQVTAINDNKEAVNELTKVVTESNVVNNNRFNQIDNRIELGREQGSAVVKEFRREFQLIWESIEELKE